MVEIWLVKDAVNNATPLPSFHQRITRLRVFLGMTIAAVVSMMSTSPEVRIGGDRRRRRRGRRRRIKIDGRVSDWVDGKRERSVVV